MKLIAVTNDRLPVEQLEARLFLIEPWIDYVILREKSKCDEAIMTFIRSLIEKGFPITKIILHERIHLADSLQLKRVQLPEKYLEHAPYSQYAIGRSVHSLTAAQQADQQGAAWLLYGHLFETKSKAGVSPRGTTELARLIQAVSVPVYAIGGIKPQHLSSLKAIGVAGVALMSPIFDTPHVLENLQLYRRQIDQ